MRRISFGDASGFLRGSFPHEACFPYPARTTWPPVPAEPSARSLPLKPYFCRNSAVLKKLLSETLIYGAGAILPRIITFLLNPILVYYINPEGFAVFTNLYAWIAYINVLLTFGFETSYFRFSAEEGQERATFNTSFWFIFLLAGSFLLMVLLFTPPLAALMEYEKYPEYLRWFAWIAFLDSVAVIPLAWLRYHSRPLQYSLIRVASVAVHSLTLVALFTVVPKGFSAQFGLNSEVSYPFFTNLLGSITTILLLLPVLKKVRWQWAGSLFRKMVAYSWPIALAGFFFQINENWDKLVQIYHIPAADAGAYGGCYKLAVLMTLFVTAYRLGIEPYFFKQMKAADAKQKYAQVTECFLLFASVIALGIIANLSWLKLLFIRNSAYWSAMDIVPIIIIANLFFGIYYNLSTWYKVTDRTWVGTLLSGAGALITIALHYFLLKQFGFMVSAWATFAAYLFMMVGSYFLGQKYYPIPYRTGKMLTVLLLLVVFTGVQVYLVEGSALWGNLLLMLFTAYVLWSEKPLVKRLMAR